MLTLSNNANTNNPELDDELTEREKEDINLAYYSGAFSVGGFGGMYSELERLKGLGKEPYQIIQDGNTNTTTNNY